MSCPFSSRRTNPSANRSSSFSNSSEFVTIPWSTILFVASSFRKSSTLSGCVVHRKWSKSQRKRVSLLWASSLHARRSISVSYRSGETYTSSSDQRRLACSARKPGMYLDCDSFCIAKKKAISICYWSSFCVRTL